MSISSSLVDLVLASAWPPRRDSWVADANWWLYALDLWRQTMCGIPSVFA